MIEKNVLAENAAVIKSKSHSVRVKQEGGEMMFAASDIVSACGIKAPTKWVKRAIATRPDIDGTMLDYPLMTSSGLRHIKMVFVSAAVAHRMINYLACPDETKAWLIGEVLTYQQEPAGARTDGEYNEQPADAIAKENPRNQENLTMIEIELNQKIDNILLELLEIKRYVMTRASLGSTSK